jgi:hypothetical protein
MTTRAPLPGEVARTGAVRVALPPEQALDLFTAPGEVHWAPGWEPRYVSPQDGAPAPGGIWLTSEDGQEVIWRVERFDRSAGEAEYLRITPGNRVVTVHVHCAPDGSHTLATVTYRVIALSPAGQEWLAEFTAERYAKTMKEWERLIAAHVATRR